MAKSKLLSYVLEIDSKVTVKCVLSSERSGGTENSGDPAPNAATVTSHIESQDLLEQIKFKAAEGIKSFMIGTSPIILNERYL